MKTQPRNHGLNRRWKLFLDNSIQKHGDQYDYTLSKIDYTSTRDPIRIECKKCGTVFKTLPQDHASSYPYRQGGCPTCLKSSGRLGIGIVKRWEKNISQRKTTWLEKASEKHQGRYLYPKLDTEFENEKSIITVVCKSCSHTFETPARVHISKERYSGCAICNKKAMAEKISTKNRERQTMNYQSKNELVDEGHIYQITNRLNQKTYIGYTTMSITKRLKSHIDSARQNVNETFKSKSHLHHAIRKYGKEAFVIEALLSLRNVTPIELGELETKFIQERRPQYNMTVGGDMWGPTCTAAQAVEVFDKNHNFVGTYRSLAQAAREHPGTTPRQIKKSALQKVLYSGYYWKLLNP